MDHRADSQVIFRYDKGQEKIGCAHHTASVSAQNPHPSPIPTELITFSCLHSIHPQKKSHLKTRRKCFQHPVVLQWEAFCISIGHFHWYLGKYEPITTTIAIPVGHCCMVSSLIAKIIATAHSWLRERQTHSVVVFKELFFWQIVFSLTKIKCCQCY